MFKKNKILASSLAAVGTGSLVTGLGSNTVQADGSNLLNFLGSFEFFRNLFYYLGLQEYKFSDMVFDHSLYLRLDSPMNERDSIKIGKDELVATRMGDENYNFLVWRIKDSEKSGKPIYVFDNNTYVKKLFDFSKRVEKEKKDIPSCVKYILDFSRANYNKESQLKMLKRRASGVYEAFLLGMQFGEQSDYWMRNYHYRKTNAKVFWDKNKALELPTPKRCGDKLKINGHEFVSIYDDLRESWCWFCFDAGKNKDMVLIYSDSKDPFRNIVEELKTKLKPEGLEFLDESRNIKEEQKIDENGLLSYFPDLKDLLSRKNEESDSSNIKYEHFRNGNWEFETIK